MLVETIAILHGLWGTAVGSDNSPDASYIGTMLNLPGPPPLVHHGAHYRLEEALLRPGPVQRPRIPIMIAGGGERVTLRQVARYADAANLGMDGTPGATRTVDDARRKLATLDQHCADHGRAVESVVPTHFVNPVMLAETAAALDAKRAALPPSYRNAQGIFGTPEDAIAFYRPYVEAGMRYFIVNLTTFDDLETPRLLAERVFPALQS
jgi:alkanesulfonate monooxygenase SsuD/methylene tetrahydromethanopterin reductase-like flavin-dependent oxidoreductase (luciferase family)